MKILLSLLLLVFSSAIHAEMDRSLADIFGINKVTVDKSKRRMYLMNDDLVVREFRVALGKRPVGHKIYEGDKRTPEGVYQLGFVMEDSQYYRSIHISYPNEQDIAFAQQLNLSPGGNIKIHGQKNGETKPSQFVQSFDWTDGCIALSNEEMDVLLALVKVGTPIEIVP